MASTMRPSRKKSAASVTLVAGQTTMMRDDLINSRSAPASPEKAEASPETERRRKHIEDKVALWATSPESDSYHQRSSKRRARPPSITGIHAHSSYNDMVVTNTSEYIETQNGTVLVVDTNAMNGKESKDSTRHTLRDKISSFTPKNTTGTLGLFNKRKSTANRERSGTVASVSSSAPTASTPQASPSKNLKSSDSSPKSNSSLRHTPFNEVAGGRSGGSTSTFDHEVDAVESEVELRNQLDRTKEQLSSEIKKSAELERSLHQTQTYLKSLISFIETLKSESSQLTFLVQNSSQTEFLRKAEEIEKNVLSVYEEYKEKIINPALQYNDPHQHSSTESQSKTEGHSDDEWIFEDNDADDTLDLKASSEKEGSSSGDESSSTSSSKAERVVSEDQNMNYDNNLAHNTSADMNTSPGVGGAGAGPRASRRYGRMMDRMSRVYEKELLNLEFTTIRDSDNASTPTSESNNTNNSNTNTHVDENCNNANNSNHINTNNEANHIIQSDKVGTSSENKHTRSTGKKAAPVVTSQVSRLLFSADNENNKFRNLRLAVVNELVSTEAEYIKDLEFMLKKFKIPIARLIMLGNKNVQGSEKKRGNSKTYWRMFPMILEVNRSLVKLLELEKDKPLEDQRVGKVFNDFIIEKRKLSRSMYENGRDKDRDKDKVSFYRYKDFCVHYPAAQRALSWWKVKDGVLKRELAIVEKEVGKKVKKGEMRSSDLASFLIKPLQRICQYPLLLKQVLKWSRQEDVDYEELVKSMSNMQMLLNEINGKLEEAEEGM